MVIGFMGTGILSGFFGMIFAFSMGAPMWVSVLAYPMIGLLAALSFIAVALTQDSKNEDEGSLSRHSPAKGSPDDPHEVFS